MKFKPKKSLGQNFLNNKYIVEKIFEKYKFKKDDSIIEIGPGLGALTDFIYNKTKNLILIEKDKKIFEFLKNKYKSNLNIEIFNFDFLDFDFSIIKNKKYRIIGNLPFNVATRILKELLFKSEKWTDLYLSFSDGVAQKIIAKPKTKTYSFLSVFAQSFAKIESIYSIDPKFFDPIPKVITTFLKFDINNNKSPFLNLDFYNFVLICFKQKRKTLLNNLKKHYNFDLNKIIVFLKSKNLKIDVRSEWLILNDFLDLFNFLKINKFLKNKNKLLKI